MIKIVLITIVMDRDNNSDNKIEVNIEDDNTKMTYI